MARSLNFLGTVLKVIAGPPDAADFDMLKMSEARLIESNNRQVIIKTQNKFNELTEIVNKIIKAERNNIVDTSHLYEVFLARNRILITGIQNVMLTVTLAKANIINPAIFNQNDLMSVFVDHPTEVPIISLLEASNIRVLQSDSIIHVLIAYPKTKTICKKVTIFPVSHQYTILQLKENTVAECNSVQEYTEPKHLFSLRSFLGLASYYRSFVKDFATIARPLTSILKGENGTVNKHMSKKVAIEFDETQRKAFKRLRDILSSEDMILTYPDFKLPFDLTTDASASGIGAVLSQKGRPIIMISRRIIGNCLGYRKITKLPIRHKRNPDFYGPSTSYLRCIRAKYKCQN